MAIQSLVATKEGLAIAKRAKTRKALTNAEIARANQPDPIDEKTVSTFFAGKPISVKNFQGVCKTLGIDWEILCGKKPPENSETEQPKVETKPNPTYAVSTKTITQQVVNNFGIVAETMQGNLTIMNQGIQK